MGYRPQQPQGGEYGQQPELRPGATVISADGAWRGTVVDLAGQGADAAVRVQWEGYGLTYVTLGMLMHDNGRWVVRSEGGAQGAQGGGAQAAQAGGAAQGGYGAQAAQGGQGGQREQRGAADDMTMMAGNAPRPQPQPQAPSPQPRTPAPQPTMGDDMTRMPQAAPRPATQGTPQSPPKPTPYYSEGASLPANMQGREEAMMVEAREGERVVVPIIEERLEAHPEWREAGSVRLNVLTEEVPQSVTRNVEREEVTVERVAVGRALAEGEDIAPRQEGDTFIVPVIMEEIVVSTRRVLAEEVRMTKRIVTVPETVETTIRQQRVEVDGGALTDRIHERKNET